MGEGKRMAGQIGPSVPIPKIKREDGPDAYKTFQEKNDGCIKVVINP
jgi:threonine dehydrogenase-like Zn-dependent dehydrogenase